MDSTLHDLSRVLIELGLVVVGLALLARIASRWSISSIPFYLLAGLAFGNGGLGGWPGHWIFVGSSSCCGVRIALLQFQREWQEGVPRASGLRVGVFHAEGLETLLRTGRPTFSHVQLLPAVAAVGHRASAQSLVQALGKIRERYRFHLVGYVVMPNHVHLLIGESPKATPSEVLKVLKQRVSRDLRKRRRQAPAAQLRLAFPKDHGCLPRFWEPRFYDFNVWSKKKLNEKLEYMHANPVTRNLVDHPQDWPWSSWSFYAKGEGVLRLDPV